MLCICQGFPDGSSGKEPAYQCRRHKKCQFDPWVRKIPWKSVWQPTLVFLPGKSHGQRSLTGYGPWCHKESDRNEVTEYAHSSVQFSCSVGSNSFQLQGLQYTRLPCPSPTPRACPPTHVHWVGDAIHLILCRPLLLLPSIFPIIRVFSNEWVLCIRWPKDESFGISPSNEHSRLISFRTDWFDFLAVQGTLKSLLQHHSSNTSILQRSAFFMV